MACNEPCKHCGHKEAAHDVANDIRYSPRPACVYLRSGVSREEALDKEFSDQDFPCEGFESTVTHEPWCDGYREINGVEHLCYESGGCQALRDMN